MARASSTSTSLSPSLCSASRRTASAACHIDHQHQIVALAKRLLETLQHRSQMARKLQRLGIYKNPLHPNRSHGIPVITVTGNIGRQRHDVFSKTRITQNASREIGARQMTASATSAQSQLGS